MSIDDYEELVDSVLILLMDLARLYESTGKRIREVISEYANNSISFSEVLDKVSGVINQAGDDQAKILESMKQVAGYEEQEEMRIKNKLNVDDVIKYLFDSEREQFVELVNIAMRRKARWL